MAKYASGLLRCCLVIVPVLLLSSITTPSFAQDNETVDFNGYKWRVSGLGWKLASVDGREALELVGANAVVQDLEFYNGTISVDIRVGGERGFTSIRWRRQPDFSGENFLIRNHKSGERDAAQYEVFHGYRSSWQLYNHDGYTTHLDIPTNAWIPVKIVVENRSADIYVNSDTPILHIAELRGSDLAGAVQLNGALAGALFSDFRIEPNKGERLVGKSAGLPGPPEVEAAIGTWRLSEAIDDHFFDVAGGELPDFPPVEWRVVEADKSGILNISEYVAAPSPDRNDDERTTAIAATAFLSDRGRRVSMTFGFSDAIKIYLNGSMLYEGQNRFMEEDRRFQGLVTGNSAVVLDLDKGRNDLIFLLKEDDRFGWGFLTELDDLEGLTLSHDLEMLR